MTPHKTAVPTTTLVVVTNSARLKNAEADHRKTFETVVQPLAPLELYANPNVAL